ncbi:hypothetical protein N9L68_04310 [bacterium]|nr:hypothetical protein [bacterium]
MQALILVSERKAKQLAEGIRHMEFVARLQKQVEGRLFIHGNLARAKPWALPCIRNLLRKMGVNGVDADSMCGSATLGPPQVPTYVSQATHEAHYQLAVDGAGAESHVRRLT